MRLLLTIGYEKLLLPKDANVAAILNAIAAADYVTEKRADYSKPAKYAIKIDVSGVDAPVFVHQSQIIQQEEVVEMDVASLKKQNSDLREFNSVLKTKFDALEKKVAVLISSDAGENNESPNNR